MITGIICIVLLLTLLGYALYPMFVNERRKPEGEATQLPLPFDPPVQPSTKKRRRNRGDIMGMR